MTNAKQDVECQARDRPAGKLRRSYNWERGTRAERRQREENAFCRLSEIMKALDHWTIPEPDGFSSQTKKKSRWKFRP